MSNRRANTPKAAALLWEAATLILLSVGAAAGVVGAVLAVVNGNWMQAWHSSTLAVAWFVVWYYRNARNKARDDAAEQVANVRRNSDQLALRARDAYENGIRAGREEAMRQQQFMQEVAARRSA